MHLSCAIWHGHDCHTSEGRQTCLQSLQADSVPDLDVAIASQAALAPHPSSASLRTRPEVVIDKYGDDP